MTGVLPHRRADEDEYALRDRVRMIENCLIELKYMSQAVRKDLSDHKKEAHKPPPVKPWGAITAAAVFATSLLGTLLYTAYLAPLQRQATASIDAINLQAQASIAADEQLGEKLDNLGQQLNRFAELIIEMKVTEP